MARNTKEDEVTQEELEAFILDSNLEKLEKELVGDLNERDWKGSDRYIQSIITLIDSDIPDKLNRISPMFESGVIVLKLHDENEQGRLFKIKTW